MSALQARGTVVRFGLSCVEILRKSLCLATGSSVEKTYVLRSAESGVALVATEESDRGALINPTPNTNDKSTASNEIPKSAPTDLGRDRFLLWHDRMGPVGAYGLTVLADATKGAGARLHDHEKERKCIICTQTKMTRIVNRNLPDRATRRLERVCMDFGSPYRLQIIKYRITLCLLPTNSADIRTSRSQERAREVFLIVQKSS